MNSLLPKPIAKRLGLSVLLLLMVSLFESCGFCGKAGSKICALIGSHPLSKSVAPNNSLMYELPNTFVIYHGSACAESNESGTEIVPKIEESLALPAYVTHATVYLNGWHLRYLDDDHHVAGLGVAIDSIRLERNVLKWQAAGILSDKNFDDGYNWCYEYTVIAWNAATLNLFADHKDGNCSGKDNLNTNFYMAGNTNANTGEKTTTALTAFASFLQNPNFANAKTTTVLPRGFAFDWTACDEDHHLLQLAYNLGHTEAFLEKGKMYQKGNNFVFSQLPTSVNQSASGYVSWETSAIYKDNDGRRDYEFGELVSGLSGNDLGVIEPPFSILPKEDHEGTFSTCVSSGQGLRSDEFVVSGIPYEYAMPVLTGWDLVYDCDDEHIKEIGTWISGFSYEKAPNATTGILRYKVSSVLKDKNNDPNFESRHKVNILGLKPTAAEKPPIGVQQQESNPKQQTK